jgi:hypothetical protein
MFGDWSMTIETQRSEIVVILIRGLCRHWMAPFAFPQLLPDPTDEHRDDLLFRKDPASTESSAITPRAADYP